MEELLEWLRSIDSALRAAEPPSSEASEVRLQLKEQRPLNDEVAAQRVRVRDLLSQAKKVTPHIQHCALHTHVPVCASHTYFDKYIFSRK